MSSEIHRVYISHDELLALCSVAMSSDPMPDDVDPMTVHGFLNQAAQAHGYTDWIAALHAHAPTPR